MKPGRKQSPVASKQLDYDKQRRGFGEHPHSLRHGGWRRKKRRPAQQAERQAERIAVATRAASELRDPGFDPGSITRPRIRKWRTTSLGEWVEFRKRLRVEHAGSQARRKALQR